MPHGTSTDSLHEACYLGDVKTVGSLLASGTDPNAPADPSGREWISCAGGRPKALNCVAIAWAVSDAHVEIARLLIEHGAIVDDSVLDDHAVEMTLRPNDQMLHALLLSARNRQAPRGL